MIINSIQNIRELKEIEALSYSPELDGVFIFKHSTRCSISRMVWGRIQRSWDLPNEKSPLFYLDILSFREISNEIARIFSVEHESPQLIGIKNGKYFYASSHTMIRIEDVHEAIKKVD